MAGAGMAQLSEATIAERLAAITIPTLILFGEADNVVPPGNADLLAQKLPNAQVKILRGAGHIFPIENPSATVAAITNFLTSTPHPPP